MSGRTHAAVAAALAVWTAPGWPASTGLLGWLAAGLLSTDPAAGSAGRQWSVWVLSVLAGGLLPDLDEPNSALGRRLGWIAWPLKLAVGHRTLTHSVLGILLVGLVVGIAGWWQGWPWILPAGVMVGMAVHVALDSLTGSIQLWWPASTYVGVTRWRVCGWQDRLLGLLGAGLAVGGLSGIVQ